MALNVSTSKIVELLEGFGYNDGEPEEIIAELASGGHIEYASARTNERLSFVGYELHLSKAGVRKYENWCQKNGYCTDLKEKVENVLLYDDEDDGSVRETLLEWGILTTVELVEIIENFPNDGEAYAILRGEDGRYAFAWGPKYPYANEIPANNVLDGENGLEWYEAESDARTALEKSVAAWEA